MSRVQKVHIKNASSLKHIIQIQPFLCGDRAEIIKLGDIYAKVNNLSFVSPDQIRKYLSAKPLYIGEQTKAEWGMSLEDARRCLYDIPRTQKLIQGIVKGIEDLQKETTQELHVVEAGGGTGILAIAAALAGARVTLLEINPETEKDTKKFMRFLGLLNRINVKLVDATQYVPDENFDMIICECLHTGLGLEPQLQIMHHLGKFLKPQGKLIPEGVYLRWALADVNWGDILEQHTEQRYIQEKIYSIGNWVQTPYLDFKTEIKCNRLEQIEFVVPMHKVPANTILVEMDVVIYMDTASPIVLQSGEAEFLGHPHAIKLQNSISTREGTHAFGYFFPGENFPMELAPLSRSL